MGLARSAAAAAALLFGRIAWQGAGLVAAVSSASTGSDAALGTHSLAERVRSRMVPNSHEMEESVIEQVKNFMDEAVTVEQVKDFQRLRSAGPIWANHSREERTANLRLHLDRRRNARRRRLQRPGASADSSAQARDSILASVLDYSAGSTCDDPLATNTGRALPCTYDCADLRQAYFPQPQTQATRCFLFDPATETWPEVGGQGAELLSMRQQRFETHTYVSREDGTNPPPSGLSFTMGEGRECRNVTIKTTMIETGVTHIEKVCLVDGEHEYNHTISEQHSIEVVGYAESEVYDGAGGTTRFVVGMCTYALIRVTTTSAGGNSITWSLDDGGQNGPWTFETSAEIGVDVYESCMFDGEFTLTNLGVSSW
eukprot:COSAG04_NODE_476_length_13722_cov_16.614707_5_plen_371_part_00